MWFIPLCLLLWPCLGRSCFTTPFWSCLLSQSGLGLTSPQRSSPISWGGGRRAHVHCVFKPKKRHCLPFSQRLAPVTDRQSDVMHGLFFPSKSSGGQLAMNNDFGVAQKRFSAKFERLCQNFKCCEYFFTARYLHGGKREKVVTIHFSPLFACLSCRVRFQLCQRTSIFLFPTSSRKRERR